MIRCSEMQSVQSRVPFSVLICVLTVCQTSKRRVNKRSMVKDLPLTFGFRTHESESQAATIELMSLRVTMMG